MEQVTMFEHAAPQPLAARLRPAGLAQYVGQTHLLGPGKVLRRLIEDDRISSMIFWGPRRLHRLLRRHQRHQGDPRCHAAGRGKPPLRRENHRLCG